MNLKQKYFYSFILTLHIYINPVYLYALPGKIDFTLTRDNNEFVVPNRGLYNQTQIQLKISCEHGSTVKIGWLLRESHCIDEFYSKKEDIPDEIFENIFVKPETSLMTNAKYAYYIKSEMREYNCTDANYIDLYTDLEYEVIKKNIESKSSQNVSANDQQTLTSSTAEVITKEKTTTTIKNARKRRATINNSTSPVVTQHPHEHHEYETIAHTWSDSAYLFILRVESVNNKNFELHSTISFKYKDGYLSAGDWPFLPFYAVMCAIYMIYAIVWFTCSCCYWRDLLRVQFWIGALILLGMIEKAAFLAEYESINKNGYSVKVGMILAEFVSCLKRSLARMLVIIVSLGFGIVKPRLGESLHKVVATGVIYFILAIVDGVFRILDRKEDTDSKNIIASIPLVILDVSICYWILSNLQQTMRTLRVRRNIPKLTLYRHFTNTLIFCVIASVIFMIWSLKRHRFMTCLKDWKELWLDEGFWHILFSFILLVIIILWRPSNNSQRFLFTPLLDEEEDEEDGNQENEVFDSVKMRNKTNNESTLSNKSQQKEKTIEDELKWVEEHVPASVTETALPGIIDSDEEVMTTRFEMSKMD